LWSVMNREVRTQKGRVGSQHCQDHKVARQLKVVNNY